MAVHATDGNSLPKIWRVSWQNWHGHVPGVGMAKPPVRYRDFKEKSDAETYKKNIRDQYPDAIACITEEGGELSRSPAKRGVKTKRQVRHETA